MKENSSYHLAPVITWRTTLVTRLDCPTCKLVALVLSLYMNERGGSAFPSAATLAADCSLTDRAVRKHLNEHLHAQGWLTLIERGGLKGGHARANEWQASTPEPGSGVGGEPRNVVPRPLNESAETPEPGSAQVVQEQVHDLEGVRRSCLCGKGFADINLYCEHIEQCADYMAALDEGFTPADKIRLVK